jgi:DNA-binding transcriptional ArsR family regulator
METSNTQIQTNIIDELVEACDSKFFKTLSEPVRVEILKFIMLNGRADISTIAEHLPQDRSVISRHLNLMNEVGILRSEKESRHLFYEINGNAFLDKLENITKQIKKCMELCCSS